MLLFVLPGYHLCPIDALRLPDDANSLLWVVQMIQQHTDHVVPVSGTLIGLRCLLVAGGARTDCINL